jgi:hypothetical protein
MRRPAVTAHIIPYVPIAAWVYAFLGRVALTLPSLMRNKLVTSRPSYGICVDCLEFIKQSQVVCVLEASRVEEGANLLAGSADGELAWDLLISNIRADECVPFLGAGACDEFIPLAGRLAANWGDATGYPLSDTTNLARVMQYVATTRYRGDVMSLKRDFIRQEIQSVNPPNFGDSGQIHGVLAKCNLSLYVTTNYDDFMYLALQYWSKRPQRDYSTWYAAGEEGIHDSPLASKSAYEPTSAEPLVFHLHGHQMNAQSLVLTEDDYIEYLVKLASDTNRRAGMVSGVLPAYIRGQLRSKPLLFIGYSLRDWTFLVLFRTLLHGIPDVHRRNHVSVQVDPAEPSRVRAREYIERYLAAQRIQIFWGSARDFARELSDRLGGAGS